VTPAKSTGPVTTTVRKRATARAPVSGDRPGTAAKKAPAGAAKKAPAGAAKKAPAGAAKKAPAGAAKKVPAGAAKKVPAGAAKKAPRAKAAPKKVEGRPYAKDTKFLDEQRVLLAAERAIYREQAQDLKAEADSLAEEREPGDVQFDEESGEGGTVAVDRERDLVLSAQAQAAVEEIDAALVRIELGTYGACERCHQPIPKARLRALPYARLCVACKSGGLSRR